MSTAYASDRQTELERAIMLLDAYRASELAHRRAADRAASREEREGLLRKAHERARFARELDTELSMMGGPNPEELEVSDRGDSPHGWPRADDDLASLVARTELRVRSELQSSLAGPLPSELQPLVERQARAFALALVPAVAVAHDHDHDHDHETSGSGSSVSLRRE